MRRILTLGYGDRGFDAVTALLHERAVTHVVDVRSVPQFSYWEDFRRERLSLLLPERSLRYVWMGDSLGGVPDSPELCKEPGKTPLGPLRREPAFQRGLDRLIEAAETRSLCLLCGCKEPRRCHRSRLIGAALLEERGVDVVHVDAADREVAQSALDQDLRTLFD